MIGRLCTVTLFVLLLATPVSADHTDWRPGPVSRLAAMDAALMPVMADLASARQGLIEWNAQPWDLDKMPQEAATWQAVLLAFQAVAIEGLGVLDQYPADQCWADYAAVLRTGFLLMGDAIAEFPAGSDDLSTAMRLLWSDALGNVAYADLIRSATDCA